MACSSRPPKTGLYTGNSYSVERFNLPSSCRSYTIVRVLFGFTSECRYVAGGPADSSRRAGCPSNSRVTRWIRTYLRIPFIRCHAHDKVICPCLHIVLASIHSHRRSMFRSAKLLTRDRAGRILPRFDVAAPPLPHPSFSAQLFSTTTP
jgi:hypothetical protein